MALANDQSITISGTTSVLPRVYEEANVGTFIGADRALTLAVRPSVTKANRSRRVVELNLSKNATDPISGVGARVESRVTLLIDSSMVGWSDDDLVAAVAGLSTWLTAGTNANLKKVVAGEN